MSIGDKELTVERLRERVNYDANTGIMTLKTKPIKGGRTPIGGAMGSVHPKGYLYLNLDGRRYLVHRLVWMYVYGEWPDSVDHINHVRSDNRLANLRNIPGHENQKNMKLGAKNASGVPGISWSATRNKWEVYITSKRNRVSLGRFADFFEAVCTRKSAELALNFHPNHGSIVS